MYCASWIGMTGGFMTEASIYFCTSACIGRSIWVLSTSQLLLMLYGPIVKVSWGMFPSHAEWTFCQNVPGTVAPDAHKVESHMSLQQMPRKIEQLLESHHVRMSHFSQCARFPLSPQTETVANELLNSILGNISQWCRVSRWAVTEQQSEEGWICFPFSQVL